VGLDYSYVLVSEQNEEIKNFIIKHSEEKINISGNDDCLCISFPLDAQIREYFENFDADWKSKCLCDFMHDNIGRIGCIYYSRYAIDDLPGYYKHEFTAAISSMSRLFENSPCIKKWFIDLSRASNSIMTYMDLEDSGIKLIYDKGCETDIIYDVYYDYEDDKTDIRYKKICDDTAVAALDLIRKVYSIGYESDIKSITQDCGALKDMPH